MPSLTLPYRRAEACRICSEPDLEQVLGLGDQPLANALLANPQQQEGVAPLDLLRCESCAALQLGVTVEPAILFRDYVWVTGTSPATLEHCAWLAERIIEHVGRGARAIEMASNDGTFLGELQSRGMTVLGVDPARNLAEFANERGVETLPEFFDSAAAAEIRASRGPYDVAIARNVLSHVPDPRESVAALAHCLGPLGVAVIEFHRADVIARELHYDSIYHEHTMYHSLKSMTSILEGVGLQPFDVLPSPISGGSWVLFAARADASRGQTTRWSQAWADEESSGVWSAATWHEFADRVADHQAALRHEVAGRAAAGQVVVAYGASARSSTVLNACQLSVRQITSIADGNPRKQGLFSPGMRIPIEAPGLAMARRPDAILLLAFNFRSEIEGILRREAWNGDLIHAFPNRVEVVEFR